MTRSKNWMRRRGAIAIALSLALGGGWFLLRPTGGSRSQERTVEDSAQHRGLVSPSSPINHVIFMIKENRTFDHYFGGYPGADGVSKAGTLRCTNDGCRAGEMISLKPAPDVQPHDITHGFASGLYGINGGEMNGFNIIGGGRDLSGYVQHSRRSLPAYWAYADRFVLADRFFTSMYGPTFPEHLFTVAAQSFDVVDNPSSEDAGNCDNRIESRNSGLASPSRRSRASSTSRTGSRRRSPNSSSASRRTGTRPSPASTSRCFPISSRGQG